MATALFILRVGEAAFADVPFVSSTETVRELSARASAALTWGLRAPQVALFLVTPGVARAAEADVRVASDTKSLGAQLFSGDTLAAVGVAPGSWLIARSVTADGGSAGAAAAAASDVVALLGAFIGETLPASQAAVFRFHYAFSSDRASLLAGAFKAHDAISVRAKLRNVLSTSTRAQFLLESGVVLDGPVGASVGRAGTAIFFALRGARVLCAKVGLSAVIRHEWAAMVAVHGDGARVAPTVARAEACEDVPSDTIARAALLMPLFPLSVADAAAALPAGPGRARDALAASVALCGLAAVEAFARAGWAHGDIKPANLMLTGGASAACVLIDLGTARAAGEIFVESSLFSLNELRCASAGYDLVCLGATLAMLQHEIFVEEGVTTRASLLEAVRLKGDIASSGARPPASLVAEAALALGAQRDVPPGTLRALANEVAAAAASLGSPALDDIWPRNAS